jgi:hypothetical protein
MSIVVQLADYPKPPEPCADELAAWPYWRAIEWAAYDFDRLVAVCRARAYHPGWVRHRMATLGLTSTPNGEVVLQELAREFYALPPPKPQRKRKSKREDDPAPVEAMES